MLNKCLFPALSTEKEARRKEQSPWGVTGGWCTLRCTQEVLSTGSSWEEGAGSGVQGGMVPRSLARRVLGGDRRRGVGGAWENGRGEAGKGDSIQGRAGAGEYWGAQEALNKCPHSEWGGERWAE